jgi:hypothetical protein
MGEAKRRRDLGAVIFRPPDPAIWGTAEGIAKRSGKPANDPDVLAGSETPHALWSIADGKSCSIVLAAVTGLLGSVFNQMARLDRQVVRAIASQFCDRLLDTVEAVQAYADSGEAEREAVERRAQHEEARAKPKN